MKVQTKSIRSLIDLLRRACHAKECDTTFRCPRQCRCRVRRPFKLNTETAICYELADRLNRMIRNMKHNRALKVDIEDIIETATAYVHLSQYHMSRGWIRFFEDVRRCIITSTTSEGLIWPRSIEQSIEDLKYRINRLKRYPK